MKIDINIISDIMCPWCIIGFKRLEKAMEQFDDSIDFNLEWHPFELNPKMPDNGQNLHEWLSERYNMSKNDIVSSRIELTEMGKELGFVFNYQENTRMYNTFKSHQLLHFAVDKGAEQTKLKMALFKAHFMDNLNISETFILLDIVNALGVDTKKAELILTSDSYKTKMKEILRDKKRKGINAVPSFTFDNKCIIEGAQHTDVFNKVIQEIIKSK